jgi:hypothetical protein
MHATSPDTSGSNERTVFTQDNSASPGRRLEELGHGSIEMTLRYSHLTPDVKPDAVRLLDRPAR